MEESELKKVIKILSEGGVIAYPTDTLFGIGCDATNQESIKKIYEIKGRDFSKPFSIACSDIEMIKRYAKVNNDIEKVINKILPGPYTLILEKTELISDLITAGSDKVGVRIPDYPRIIKVIKEFGKPIITTSANLSGQPDITKYDDITLPVDYILKGECRYNKPSTVFVPIAKRIIREGQGVEKINILLGAK